MKKKLIIIGAGSVGKFIAYNPDEFLINFEIIGFLDDDLSKHNTSIAGVPVLGKVEKIIEYSGKGYALVWGIAFPKIKSAMVEKFAHLDFDYPNFISKNAWLSNRVTIGKGNIIYPGCAINYETTIADFIVLNMNCALGHGCSIGSFTSLSPGVNLGGNTILETKVEMGIGAATLQSITIGKNTQVGGQAMVTKNMGSDLIVKGLPARVFS